MTRRILGAGTAGILGAALVMSVPAASQTTGQTPHVAMTGLNGATTTSYSTAKTPWGDPDLQGIWSSDDMRGVPRERPAEFGNRLYLNDKEYADRLKRDEEIRRRGDNAIGTFRNDVGFRTWRQTSLVVDP